MRKCLLTFLLLPLLTTAQLKEFQVTKMEQPDVPIIQASTQFPDDAILLVYTSLENLNFRSSLGAIDKVTFNSKSNRYEVLVKPNKQLIFVYGQGFIERKIATINPEPKDVFYYKVSELQQVSEKRGTGKLVINTLPSKANISINGIRSVDKTPFTTDLPEQRYSVRVSKDGFKTVDTLITVTSGRLKQLSLELVKKEPKPVYIPKGSIVFSSDPSGAEVHTKDSFLGVTPFQAELETGTYRFIAKKQDQWAPKITTTVTPSSNLKVHFELRNKNEQAVFIDKQGDSYKVSRLGNTNWLAEDLNKDRFNNGELIMEVENASHWDLLSVPMCSNSDQDCGRLYNWFAIADSRGLCPQGWRVATKKDWLDLEGHLNEVSDTAVFEFGITPKECSMNFREPRGKNRKINSKQYYWIVDRDDNYGVNLGLAPHVMITRDEGVQVATNSKKYGFSVRCVED